MAKPTPLIAKNPPAAPNAKTAAAPNAKTATAPNAKAAAAPNAKTAAAPNAKTAAAPNAKTAAAPTAKTAAPPPGLAGLKPSAEQATIIAAFAAGNHICIEAVAGAGKTTSMLLGAAAAPGKRCLLLTYNKRLQKETADRIVENKLTNAMIRTYHGAASAAYGTIISNDTKFIAAILNAPLMLPRFDALMLDEVQDMSIEYYIFVRYLLRGNPGAQVVVVGDPRQAIYQYKGSRAEFLTECEDHMTPVAAAGTAAAAPRRWSVCALRTSYRLTPATAAFVNNHVLGAPALVGGNTRAPDVRPRYVATSYKTAAAAMRDEVQAAIKAYGAANVAVIAPTVKSIARADTRNPLAELVRVHLAGTPTFVASRDDVVPTEEETKGKLVIGTFNSMKGCERDCVIVWGLDELYFKYNAKDWGDTRDDVPNILYVAATRARKALVVVASAKDTLRTVDLATLARDATVVGGKLKQVRAKMAPEYKEVLSVTDLLRHISSELQCALQACYEARGARRVAGVPRAPVYAATFTTPAAKTYVENVSALYGIVGPALAELVKNRKSAFGKRAHKPLIVATYKEMMNHPYSFTQSLYDSYPEGFWDGVAASYATPPAKRPIAGWFQIAVAANAFDAGAHHVARQILDYDWIDKKHVKDLAETICATLKPTAGEFEVDLPPFTQGLKTIRGRADFVEAKSGEIWEFKCCNEVQDKHLIQLACYLALKNAATGVPAVGHCYAVLGGEIATIRVSDGPALLRCALGKYRPAAEGDGAAAAPLAEAIRAFEDAHVTGGVATTDDGDGDGATECGLDDLYG